MEIKRDIYLKRLIAAKHNGLIKVITGIRRCGKSYLLFNLFHDHLRKEGVKESHIIKVNLEDRRNLALRDPDALLAYIDSKIRDDGMHYILLDEIQHVSEFEDVLNSYLGMKNADVYVTGSNSKFLSSDIITEFRGRGDEIRVHPLCFREFLSVRAGVPFENVLREYIMYGGLPQVATTEDVESKKVYLSNLFETTYLRDIKERNNIRDDSDLSELVNVLASSIGSLTNTLNLQNTFRSVNGRAPASETLKRYLDIMQDAFLIEKAQRYDVKGRRYIGSPVKYYFEDLGLRNARLEFRQLDEGHLMENMIYNELRLRGYSVDVGQVRFNGRNENGTSMRRNLEVDFVANRGFTRHYIQSSFSMGSTDTEERERRPLMQIRDGFSKMVIVGGLTPTHQNEDGIIIMNVYDFLRSDDLRV